MQGFACQQNCFIPPHLAQLGQPAVTATHFCHFKGAFSFSSATGVCNSASARNCLDVTNSLSYLDTDSTVN